MGQEAIFDATKIINQNNLVLNNYLTSYASDQKNKSKKKKKKGPKKPSVPVTFDIMIKKSELLPKPIEIIISYLATPFGPGLDVFRFKMLSTQHLKAISILLKCENTELHHSQSRYNAIQMFNTMDFLKY
jgi:hypothetical protein